jgi:hypothetical protein
MEYMVLVERMIGELERICKDVVDDGGSEKNKINLSIAGILAYIRNENLPNICLQLYH